MQFSFHTIIIPDYPNPGEYLLYNTRSQAMIKINHELKCLIDHFSQPDYFHLRFQYADEILQLHRSGILTVNDQEDLNRLKDHMQQIKYSLDTKLLFVTILTTYMCNFKCVYCFEESSRANEKMTMETAEQTMDWIKARVLKLGYKSLYLNFYGGEPLLNKPVLDHIATSLGAWCESLGLKFKFMIQTNGYLLTPGLVNHLLTLGLVQVRVSVDGVGQDHDRNRPLRGGGKTFDMIMNNIMASYEKLPIGLSVSFDKGEVGHIERLFSYFQEKGILHKLGNFIFAPIQAALGPKGEKERIQNTHCECNFEDETLIQANRKIRELMIRYGLEMKSGMATSICPVTRENSGMTIDPLGRIFKCNSMLGHPELSVGHVRDNEYNKQHQTFMHLDVYNQCPQDCPYMPMCSGGCRLSAFLKSKNFTAPICHKLYLDKMAPEIIKQDYQAQRKKNASGVL